MLDLTPPFVPDPAVCPSSSTELHIRIISARGADPAEVRDYEKGPR